MIRIENLVKRYGDLVALDHLNLTIDEGEVYGILGPNGSGKTTAINCILALLKYDKGTIRVWGEQMKPNSYHLKKQIGVIMQNVAVFEQMNVYENIDYFCGLYISDKAERKRLVSEAIAFVGLEDFAKFKPKKLSGGLLRRLNIACGIAHKPKLIIMDEPTVAVDPQSRNNIIKGIQKLNAEGATIIYTSHYMEEVEQICSKISIIDHGRCIATGTKEELKSLIKAGEKITIESIHVTDEVCNELLELPHIYKVDYKEQALEIECSGAQHNLVRVLHFLEEKKLAFGKVSSSQPTLNDVFLEITGKELRD